MSTDKFEDKKFGATAYSDLYAEIGGAPSAPPRSSVADMSYQFEQMGGQVFGNQQWVNRQKSTPLVDIEDNGPPVPPRSQNLHLQSEYANDQKNFGFYQEPNFQRQRDVFSPFPQQNDSPPPPQVPGYSEPSGKMMDPLEWMGTVMQMDSMSVDGTVPGLTAELEHFRVNIFDNFPKIKASNKLAFWTPQQWEQTYNKITKRLELMENTLVSIQTTWASFDEVKKDLDDAERLVQSIGELSILSSGVTNQILQLERAGTTLARVTGQLDNAIPQFYVPVKDINKQEILEHKEALKSSLLGIKDKQKCQLERARENKNKVDRYTRSHEEIEILRATVSQNLQTFMRSADINQEPSPLVQKIIEVETKHRNYITASQQFLSSAKQASEKNQAKRILEQLQEPMRVFNDEVNRFFRFIATTRRPPIISSHQLNEMTESNIALEDSNNRKTQEINELKSQLVCQEAVIADLREEAQEKQQLLDSLQSIVEEQNQTDGAAQAEAMNNLVEAQDRNTELLREVTRLKGLADANRECQICNEEFDHTEFWVFNPCGHKACKDCFPQFNNVCPFCRVEIQGTIPYLPIQTAD